MKNEKHEFAFFSDEVTRLVKEGKEYALTEKELVHRLGTIVRVRPGETIVLFNTQEHAQGEIVACSKKDITVRVIARKKNKIITPAITWLLPLLERDDFEQALYALTAMGAAEIIPVITEKSRRSWGTEKELERAQRIMIAAAEQSKQFCLPSIVKAVPLTDVVGLQGIKIFFDAQGAPAFDVVQKLHTKLIEPLVCCVGPEGDLTNVEKELMRKNDFMLCALTPTILKASAAVEVGMGLLRSCLRSSL